MTCPLCSCEPWRVNGGILCPKCLKFWSDDGRGLQPSYRTPQSVSPTDKEPK